jgi:methionine sulfoxide reductase heme-binding subunit
MATAAPARRGGIAPWLMHAAAKPVLFVLALLPFAWLMYGAVTNNLGANPAEYLIRSTGDWTLRFLCITLAVTPLRVITATPALARFRRMLGLFVYFYVVLHLLSYSWFDMGFDVAEIAKDIVKRPFILVGFSGFVLLTPLAATSFNRAVKALGARRWQALHKLVYVIAGLGILHFFWMRAGKNNFGEVAIYAAILAVLLGWRLVRHLKARAAAAPNASGPPASRARG